MIDNYEFDAKAFGRTFRRALAEHEAQHGEMNWDVITFNNLRPNDFATLRRRYGDKATDQYIATMKDQRENRG